MLEAIVLDRLSEGYFSLEKIVLVYAWFFGKIFYWFSLLSLAN